MAIGRKLWHTLRAAGRNARRSPTAPAPAPDGIIESARMGETATLSPDSSADAAEVERLPWEEADLTSDEDVTTDTLTPERLAHLRDLADRFASAPQG